ncbi:MAG: FecR domain-containing protein, partial [Devosia sp.]
MPASNSIFRAVYFLAALFAASPVLATGTALGVKTDASVEVGSVTTTLVVGYDLNIGDRVITDDTGLVQILFEDQTELVVGPNSELVLEDYLLRADGSAGKFAINALSGTFRFATGLAPKDSYEITTPTGTIGVRGTAFDFFVAQLGTDVLVYHGGVDICSLANKCVRLSNRCEVGHYDNSESMVLGTGVNAELDRDDFRKAFLYAFSQQPLMRQFRVPNANNCTKKVVAEVKQQKEVEA